MDGLSLTRLREYLLLQLTIETERCEDGFELPHTDRDRSGQQHRDEAAELVLS